jgi:hypothetical protein
MMTEQGHDDKYIKCTRCRCKYHNNDDNIKIDFGYDRLGERFKNCLTCRTKRRIIKCDKNVIEPAIYNYEKGQSLFIS